MGQSMPQNMGQNMPQNMGQMGQNPGHNNLVHPMRPSMPYQQHIQPQHQQHAQAHFHGHQFAPQQQHMQSSMPAGNAMAMHGARGVTNGMNQQNMPNGRWPGAPHGMGGMPPRPRPSFHGHR